MCVCVRERKIAGGTTLDDRGSTRRVRGVVSSMLRAKCGVVEHRVQDVKG